MELPLSTFINQRSIVTDWSLVVLLRGGKHYILSEKVNRELLSEPATQGDMVLLDETATSFLGWRRLNPETEFSVFWNANPQLLEKTVRYSSFPTGGVSSTSREALDNPPYTQPTRSSMNESPSLNPATAEKKPEFKTTLPAASEKPTASMPWNIIVVLIVAMCGLLWLILKKMENEPTSPYEAGQGVK